MMKRIFLLLVLLFFLAKIVKAEDEWWNSTWHYRVKIEINTTSFERTDWPIEKEINLTKLLEQNGFNGTLDLNSIRVFEYDENGRIKYEVPSQFDPYDEFNATNNAVGILSFIMNGSTPENQKRIYYLYFDTLENGGKETPNYFTDLVYYWNGQRLNVNSSYMAYYLDINREENTSGLYAVYGLTAEQYIFKKETGKTPEFVQYSNSTHIFNFNLTNATLKHIGPVRIVFEQRGNEFIWNQTTQTEGYLIKRYVFYSRNKWIKIEQEFINLGPSPIIRNSTPAGALAFDANYAFDGLYHSGITENNKVVWAGPSGFIVAFIHLNNSHQNYFQTIDESQGRIGIQLNSTIINPNERIKDLTAIYFNETETDFPGAEELASRLYNPENISLSNGESYGVIIDALTEFDFYNLGEKILILGNNTIDPYNLTAAMNATLDVGTEISSDDETIILYNDGTHNDTVANDTYFTNTFHISPTYQPALWNVTIKAYSIYGVLLNQSIKTINVTNIYNVSINITNPVVFNGYPVNALIYVKNFRQDSWIDGASINCFIGNNQIPNQTLDYGNGTYLLSFNAPINAGFYTLGCLAEKNNNTGQATAIFMVEDLKTNMSIYVWPKNYTAQNITWFVDENFYFNANATNTANGTAYDANFTLELPTGWIANESVSFCGNIGFGLSCSKDFNVTIKNGTPPGNYLVNVTIQWKNPDNTTDTNTSTINVTVLPNVIIDVTENYVFEIVASGQEKQIGTFTINSVGNEKLENVEFDVIGLDDFTFKFDPSNFQSISPGGIEIVKVNVSIPAGYLPGNYTGKINVTTSNDGFDEIDIKINVPGTNMTVNASIDNYYAQNITSEINETFVFEANITNIGNNMAIAANITLELPQNWTANVTNFVCGDIDTNNSCFTSFEITIANRTRSGEYFLNVSSIWFEPEIGIRQNKTFIKVTVSSNVTMYIPENELNVAATHGNSTYLGNFTIYSLGNDPVENITYEFYNLDDFVFSLEPNTTILYSGFDSKIDVNVFIPYGYPPGIYSGYLIINSSDGYKNISINIQVPPSMTWNMTPTECYHLEFPENGVACEVIINNTGNLPIYFIISPPSANYTWVNQTNFTVLPTQTHAFSVLYDVTNINKGYFNSTYVVDAINASAYPDKEFLKVFLSPLIYPIVYAYLSENTIHQGGNITIYANITDQSGKGINFTTVFVYTPKGIEYKANMTRYWNSSENSSWVVSYPSTWGSTLQRGNYSILIKSFDNVGNEGNTTTYFLVYPNMSITLDTGNHYQGQTATYYLRVHDVYGEELPFSNVSIVMINANNNITFNRSQITNQYGEILEEQRQFTLASDAPTGLYTLYANASWYDSLTKKQINGSKQINFYVYQPMGNGLFVDVATTVVWYPQNVMKFSLNFYNNYGYVVDPDEINLTVYDPADNVYFAVSKQNLNKQATGYYTYNFAMPLNTSTGAFRAVVEARKDALITRDIFPFRVASGGPYDVRLQLIDTEVPVGDYLDFDLIIENKGETSQDVDVEYWVSDSLGKIYYYNSEALYTPAYTNQSFPRKAFIFSTQQPGMYWLNVKVTYDLLQQPIKKNVTFMVVPAAPTLPPTPSGPPGAPPATAVTEKPPPIEEKVSKISIIDYPTEIGIESGWARYPTIKVKNTGNVILSDIKILITGIPKTWYVIDPENVTNLKPNEVAIFSLRITIPYNERTKEYPFKIIALSNETSDEKTGILFVFSSREELLKYEIEKVKKEYDDVLNKTEQAKKDGKDVSPVLLLLNEAKKNIDDAQSLMERKDYDNALEKIIAASNLINRAREMFPKLSKAKPMVLPGLPLSTFLMILIVLILMSAILVFMIKKKIIDFSKLFKKEKTEVEMVVEALKKESAEKQALIEEKEKINKVIALLDAEMREGIISKEAYEELKKRNQEKLEEIERKLQNMK
ncbi:MAG: NEW3 domain-containing protein [Candidatus Aenigmatarchaeota archaeon]